MDLVERLQQTHDNKNKFTKFNDTNKFNDQHNITIFRPLYKVCYRVQETRESFDKEAIFRHSHFVQEIYLGCILEIE